MDSLQPPAGELLIDPGAVIGSYVIEELLGQGSEGSVYVARDSLLGRQVALKTLRVAEVGETRGVEEARMLATLEHEHIVRVYHARRHQGVWYVIYEYLAGGSLQALIERSGKLPPEQALYLISQAASGLAYVHAQGILHRDIKPHNLLLSRRGEVKLGDFGLAFDARLSRRPAAALVGTPAYIAPELWRGEPASTASDVFSLGACLFVLLCGRLPFVGTTKEQIKQAHAELLPKLPPSIPAPVAELLSAMLAKDVAARPASSELPRLLAELARAPFRSLATIRGQAPAHRASSPFSDRGPIHAVREVLRSGRDVTLIHELVRALSVAARGVELCSETPGDGLLLLEAAREVGAETRAPCGRLNLNKSSASICEIIERQLALTASGDLEAACRGLFEPARRSGAPSILVVHCPRGVSEVQRAELELLCERAAALSVTCLLLLPLPGPSDAPVGPGFERVIAFHGGEDAHELEERMRSWLQFATGDRYHFSIDALRLAAHYCRTERRFWATLALQSLLIACAAELRVVTSWAVEGARAQPALWYDPSEVPASWRRRPLVWPTPELLNQFEALRRESASRHLGGGAAPPASTRRTFETVAV